MCSGRHKDGKRPSACLHCTVISEEIASRQDSVVVQGRILQELLFPGRQQGWDNASWCGADVLVSAALCLSDEGGYQKQQRATASDDMGRKHSKQRSHRAVPAATERPGASPSP